MKKDPGHNIVILGCGNVAWHLARQLKALGGFSVAVFNHKANPALSAFKTQLKCTTGVGFKHIPADAGFYFICVSDKFIADTAQQLVIKNPNAVLVHTSGSAKLEELNGRVHGTGVFYPLQTFSKKDEVLWREVPLIIEASDITAQNKLVKLAKKFSNTVKVLSYKERLKLHLAAVLVNNFTNALYVAASAMVNGSKGRSHDLSLLLPIIKQTTKKLETLDPLVAQTGPARRGDTVVLKKHKHVLTKQPELKKLYKQLSKLIVHQQEEKQHA